MAIVSMYSDVGGCDVESIASLMTVYSRQEIVGLIRNLEDLGLIYFASERCALVSGVELQSWFARATS